MFSSFKMNVRVIKEKNLFRVKTSIGPRPSKPGMKDLKIQCLKFRFRKMNCLWKESTVSIRVEWKAGKIN